MQNRIKTIWEQSTYTCTPREGDYVSVSSKNIQEFAELLIKECASLLPEECQSKNGCHASWTIKDHFGIKE